MADSSARGLAGRMGLPLGAGEAERAVAVARGDAVILHCRWLPLAVLP